METIAQRMSPAPIMITGQLSISDAQERMFHHGVRHLPVYDGGHLVGIVSQRDIATLSAIEGVDPAKVSVLDAMSSQPYTCSPETKIAEVVGVMHSRKIGAAIVMDEGKIVGMFTVIDALAELLERLSD